MPVLILEKDPFVELENELADDPFRQNWNVRRPLYGYIEKWTGSPRFAYLSVYPESEGQGGATAVSLIDSSAPGGYSDANHNFILQSVQEVRQEKVQIVETFGDHFAFFYGEKPIILQCAGMLFNMPDFNWKNEWLKNYEIYLRGTRCVENRTRVFLGYDDVLAQGYILNTSITIDKDMPNVCPFSFAMLLTKPPADLSQPLVTESEESRYRSGLESLAVSAGGGGRSSQTALDDSRLGIEYLTEIRDDIENGVKVIDPATGELVNDSRSSEGAPESANRVGNRTAFWVTDKNTPRKQWKDENAALFVLEAEIAAQQSGVDLLTAKLALRKDAGQFPLSASASSLGSSLGRGVANKAAVIGDSPVLE